MLVRKEIDIMRSITVKPETLDACAARICEKNDAYLQHTQQLFEAVGAMSNAWQGEDNTAFTTQIGKFQGDFRQMSLLCTQYADFLRNSARAYREAQQELVSQAGRLEQ